MSLPNSPSFASWKEFFSQNPDVDKLNNNANRTLQAAHLSALASPFERMGNLSMFTTTCMLAASSMPGHVWFAHHFKFIGNAFLDDPADIKYVALCGLGDNAEVCKIGVEETFANVSFDAPTLPALLSINSAQTFNDPLAADTVDKETVFFTGVICLPPFLFSDLAALHSNDTYSLFIESISSINSWVASFNDETNAEIEARQQLFKRFLQWIWAVNQGNLIPVTPIQPAPGPVEQQWKADLHHLHIFRGILPGVVNTPLVTPNHPTGPSANPSDQLTLAMAKIADLFQKQYSDEVKTKEQKEPGWARFTSVSKTIILRAMTTDSLSAATDPTTTFTEFCNQRTAFIAHQHLLNFFESRGKARVAAPSQGISSALYSGIIRAPVPGVPENLSIFFIPKKSTSTTSNLSQHLIAQSLKSTEGQGLDTSEIKLATKQKISIPSTYHDFQTQMENFQLLLEFIFAPQSILHKQFSSVVSHIRSFEHEYEERIQSHQWFLAKFISFVDRRLQLYLESCATAPSVERITVSLINFDTIMQSIVDGTFSMDLPSVIQHALEPTKPEPNPTPNNKKRSTPEKDGGTPPKRPAPNRGEPVLNNSIHPPFRLNDGENYVENFVRRIDRLKLPTCDVCLNFHMRGSCHSLCARAETHIPAQNLSDQQRKSTLDFIKGARAQYAQQQNRPRQN